MPTSTNERAEVVASILRALIGAKDMYAKGNTAEEKAEDIGRAFKKLYAAVAQAERDGSKGQSVEPLRS
jgi:hypothetical protein